MQLMDTIKKAIANSHQKQLGTDTSEPAKTVMTKTFKMHEDQKATIEAAIEKAKEVSKTTVDTVALEFICLDYLASGNKKKGNAPAKIDATAVANLGVEAALDIFSSAFPNHNITISETAEEAA